MDARRAFQVALLALTGLLAFLLLVQYLTVILGAVLLAYLLIWPHRWIAPYVGERPAAIGLIVLTTVVLVIPFVLLVSVVVTGLSDLAGTVLGEESAANLATVNDLLQEVYGSDFDVESTLTQYLRDGQVGDILQTLLGTIGGAMAAFISLTILGLLTYSLLVSGDDLLEWAGEQVPLPPEEWAELVDRANKLLYAVVVGNVVIAVVDGSLVGLGLFITGFSGVLFWTFIAMFMALIPLVGSTIVWVPAAVYLVLTDNVLAGILLFVYGGLVIGAVDNLLRSYVGAREADLDPALFIVGVFSGLALLGPMGLFFGPIALAMVKYVVEIVGSDVAGDQTALNDTAEENTAGGNAAAGDSDAGDPAGE